jgi:hypothetical protein
MVVCGRFRGKGGDDANQRWRLGIVVIIIMIVSGVVVVFAIVTALEQDGLRDAVALVMLLSAALRSGTHDDDHWPQPLPKTSNFRWPHQNVALPLASTKKDDLPGVCIIVGTSSSPCPLPHDVAKHGQAGGKGVAPEQWTARRSHLLRVL